MPRVFYFCPCWFFSFCLFHGWNNRHWSSLIFTGHKKRISLLISAYLVFLLLKKKKESLPFKPTYLWSSLKAPTGSKVSVSIPKSFSSRINYSYVHFLHMALLPLSASSHLHNFSSAEWHLFFTLLIRNLYFLQFSRQSLSHKISHDCLSLYFWPAFECTWLWMAPSFPNVCRLQNREIVVLTFLYAPTFCFTKCTYFLGYFIYLEVILP